MKKIILYIAVMLFLFVSCDKNCLGKRPKDLKPIDWENYNDVSTVVWNLTHLPSKPITFLSDTIKISGWSAPYDLFSLCDDPEYVTGEKKGHPSIVIFIHTDLSKFQPMFDSCDFAKKIFLKGKLGFEGIHKGLCSTMEPVIIDVYDINFE